MSPAQAEKSEEKVARGGKIIHGIIRHTQRRKEKEKKAIDYVP